VKDSKVAGLNMPRIGLASVVTALVFLAACATQNPVPPSAGETLAAAGAYDAASKRRAPREGKKRDRGAMMAEYLLAMEADEFGPPRAEQLFRAVRQRDAILREAQLHGQPKIAGIAATSWQALGPSNVGGRIRAIAIDPRNTARIFIGAASGGIWVSENAGASWRPVNDFLGSLTVSTLVMDPFNPDILYAGSGEASAGLVGFGVYKSLDGGVSWTYLANTNPDLNADWRFVNRIAMHPQQANVLLAGTTNGNNSRNGAVYRSTDGGQNWTKTANFKALDLAFDPGNAQNAVAGRDDGFIAYSRDGGQSWVATAQLIASPSGRGSTARAEIAFAKSRPGRVFASIDNNKGEVWKSDDAGATWALLSTPAHLNEQGDYDNAIWVDPTNDNNVLAAGLDIYQSGDGGLAFAKVSDWRYSPLSPHADHHAIVSVPDFNAANATVYFGNDGGLYRANSIFTVSSSPIGTGWTNLNNGLAITQFYGGAGKAAAGGRIIGGTQDNGSLIFSQGTAWSTYRGGDGGNSAVDPLNDASLYGEYVYLALHRSQNGGVNSEYICRGISEGLPDDPPRLYCGAGATKKANFIAPFALDPNNSSRMLAGANSLWVSDNVKGAAPVWAKLKEPLGGDSGTNYINAIAVAEGNPDIIWVGHNGGQVYKTFSGRAAAPVWEPTGAGVLPARQVQRILIDRDNSNHVIVAFSGFSPNNLWQTHDGGSSWASITANLPQAPIFTVVRHASNANWLYVGTSVGIFTSENGGASWTTSNDGPANVRVRELFWYGPNTLIAATYGRGMYKADIAAGGPDNYQGVWGGGASENGWGLSLVQHGSTLAAGWYYYGATGQPTWTLMPGCTWNAAFTACTGSLYNYTGAWLGAYNTAALVQNAVGSMSFTFSSAANGTMQYTVNGVSGSKAISKLSFGSGTAPSNINYTDSWWGGVSEGGWGVALFQQQAVMAGAWYTYNKQGQAVWYLINGSWTSATTYQGTLTRATGSPMIGTFYDAAAFAPVTAGTITLNFGDALNASMNYSVDGVTQTKPISRLQF
jgi:photosystem II stability/assembly factor-like uncharacterized protein